MRPYLLALVIIKAESLPAVVNRGACVPRGIGLAQICKCQCLDGACMALPVNQHSLSSIKHLSTLQKLRLGCACTKASHAGAIIVTKQQALNGNGSWDQRPSLTSNIKQRSALLCMLCALACLSSCKHLVNPGPCASARPCFVST